MALKPETKTQIAILKWLKLYNPIAYEHIIKIDNEGKRSKIGNIIAVQSGLHKGASDLFLSYPVKQFHGCYLEIKPENWKLTPSKKEHYDSQMRFIEKMRKVGYAADLRIGFDSCIEFLMIYLNS